MLCPITGLSHDLEFQRKYRHCLISKILIFNFINILYCTWKHAIKTLICAETGNAWFLKLNMKRKRLKKASLWVRMWAFPLGFKLLNLGFLGQAQRRETRLDLKGIILSRVSKGETPVDHNPAGGPIRLSRLLSAWNISTTRKWERLTSIPTFNVSVNIVMRCRTVKREQI